MGWASLMDSATPRGANTSSRLVPIPAGSALLPALPPLRLRPAPPTSACAASPPPPPAPSCSCASTSSSSSSTLLLAELPTSRSSFSTRQAASLRSFWPSSLHAWDWKRHDRGPSPPRSLPRGPLRNPRWLGVRYGVPVWAGVSPRDERNGHT